MDFRDFEVLWNGKGSVVLNDSGFSVVVDPVIDISFEPDIVLITGREYSDFGINLLKNMESDKTVFVFPEDFDEEGVLRDTEFVNPSEVMDIYGVEIEPLPVNYSGKGGSGLSYLVKMGETSFYIGGLNSTVRDLGSLENRVEMAFLPLDSSDIDIPIRSAVKIKPDIAIPYLYDYSDSEAHTDAKKFRAELEDRNIKCEILEENSSEV